MAANIFIKLGTNGPAIKGESTARGHEGEVQAQSLTWGYAQTIAIGGAGSGAGAGKVEFQELHFTKFVDSTSPELYSMLASGKHFDQVVVTMQRGNGVDFATFTLGLVAVSSVEGSADGQGAPIEDVGLVYGSALWQVKGQGPTGWNRVTNRSVA